MFPELLNEAKSFALTEACKKECTFDTRGLAFFLNKRFRELYPEIEIDPYHLVRSIESCRVDLLKWGAKYDSNKNRPYFEGHEGEDVLLARKKFIENLQDLKDFYYVPKKDQVYSWILPMRKKRILISHDESTFRYGEISNFRLIFPDKAPFFNKGRGRSIMISMFMVSHNETSIFELSDDEYKEALKAHPEITANDGVNYFPRSANAWIERKKDTYFDNDQILKQFNRILNFIRYKKAFKDHEIDCIVDNARAHSTRVYDIKTFNKFPNTNCIYNEIRWTEGDSEKRVKCVNERGRYRGLVKICADLNLIKDERKAKQLKLEELRELLLAPPAFNNCNTHLQRLALEYGFNVIFYPKYHGELNPIRVFGVFLRIM